MGGTVCLRTTSMTPSMKAGPRRRLYAASILMCSPLSTMWFTSEIIARIETSDAGACCAPRGVIASRIPRRRISLFRSSGSAMHASNTW